MLNRNPLSPGLLKFRAGTASLLLATKQVIKAAPGKVYGISVINSNAVPEYVKFYDALTADVTVGTTVPVMVRMVPANDGTNDGQLIIEPGEEELHKFETGIVIIATSVRADTGTQTAPSAGLLAEVRFI